VLPLSIADSGSPTTGTQATKTIASFTADFLDGNVKSYVPPGYEQYF
jgi:hypothetical protein